MKTEKKGPASGICKFPRATPRNLAVALIIDSRKDVSVKATGQYLKTSGRGSFSSSSVLA
ncbi:MAG TPA: hypothetical protein VL122_08695 [Nitrospirota bacterium]|nr:hypothetical protein [Nitrospirota bacterium]